LQCQLCVIARIYNERRHREFPIFWLSVYLLTQKELVFMKLKVKLWGNVPENCRWVAKPKLLCVGNTLAQSNKSGAY